MRRNPAVVHFATHVLESSECPAYGMIALSLTEGKEAELLTPFEIRPLENRRGPHCAERVLLRPGCGAAWNRADGLTRAWLAAGARAVVSSRWPTPDEDGPLFQALYRNLRTGRRADPGEALRTAQLEMIRSEAGMPSRATGERII